MTAAGTINDKSSFVPPALRISLRASGAEGVVGNVVSQPNPAYSLNAVINVVCTTTGDIINWASVKIDSGAPVPVDLTAATNKGPVLGHYNPAGMIEWKGIPFAVPPVGELRWAAPLEPASFPGTYTADYDANGCPQNCNLPPGNCPSYGESEDCLYLSVVSPPTQSPDPAGYPVYFWVHGGAFEQGLGNSPVYNGTYFALNGIVVVTVNYRLGALGFMASPSLRGNYGILDQQLALRWVRTNIAGFGGDPARVTVGGQSAGAMSAGAHMISPASQGLFSQVVFESNPLALPFQTRASAGTNAANMMKYLSCAVDDVACMRGKSVADILLAQDKSVKIEFSTLLANFLPFSPMTEPGGDIPLQPMAALAQGAFAPVPFLAGSVLDEGQLFVFELFTSPVDETTYKELLVAVFGARVVPRILSLYPFEISPGNTDGRTSLNFLATDLLFFCPLRNVSAGFEKTLQGKVDPYFYRFVHHLTFDPWGENYTFCVEYVCHGSELPFTFDVFTDGTLVYYPSAAERALTAHMVDAWSNFIARGDPNAGLPLPVPYPRYSRAADSMIVLDEPGSSVQANIRSAYCDLWDSLGYDW